jgi:hypothetical protein
MNHTNLIKKYIIQTIIIKKKKDENQNKSEAIKKITSDRYIEKKNFNKMKKK